MGSDPHEIAALAKSLARELGFDLVGISRPAPAEHAESYRQWIESGQHGSMVYLERNAAARIDPTQNFPWAKSIVAVALSYWDEKTGDGSRESQGREGKIARYAWGRDYHKVFEARLRKLERALRAQLPEGLREFRAKTYSDTGPLLEREIAARAGLGWIGKHTLLIHPRHGSWFLLGELLTSLEMSPDEARMEDHCGTCTRCIEACPTEAITPYAVDGAKCISYQTLENRAEIPAEFHAPMAEAGYLIGCDICQEVCPFNRKPLATREEDFAAREPAPRIALPVIQGWTEQEWDIATRGRASRRAKFAMWKRNAEMLMTKAQGPMTKDGG